jgi:hypothetical protein
MGEAKLSMAVQAVEVSLVHRGRTFRGIVPRAVFETRFGTSDEPAAWLASYHDNAAIIDAALRRKAEGQLTQRVVVLHEVDVALVPLPGGLGRASAANGLQPLMSERPEASNEPAVERSIG